MSNWKLFRRSLADHPGLQIGYIWPVFIAGGAASRVNFPPIEFWLIAYPIISAIPWLAILYTAWTARKQYADVVKP